MLLPWGDTTILGKVIGTLQSAGLEKITVITGGDWKKVGEEAGRKGAQVLFNDAYQNGEMLSSLQCGINHLVYPAEEIPPISEVDSALICLGDQPQIQVNIIQLVIHRHLNTGRGLVIPSYNYRRGHPWLVAKKYWGEILALKIHQTPRDFLNRHKDDIVYVDATDPSIIADIDTMDDYHKMRPK
jgi:molybdenum cofactor cytidylyltransferase